MVTDAWEYKRSSAGLSWRPSGEDDHLRGVETLEGAIDWNECAFPDPHGDYAMTGKSVNERFFPR